MVSHSHSSPECRVCGGRRPRRLWNLRFESHPGPFRLWRCDGCGVAFNWPQLPLDSINDQYGADYYIFTLPLHQRWARAAQLYLQYLHPVERSDRRRLLDVGCAQGDLLALARQRGWDVHGVEISPAPARHAAEKYGIPVEVGTLEETAPGLQPFDVVIATDVIEHVPHPRPFMQGLRRVLRPGGLAILETPNFGGFWSRFGGARWIGLNRFHLFLFTASSLVRLMRSSGFHSCRAETCTHTAHVHWGQRPELGGFIGALPAGVRWRVQRGLNNVTPSSLGADLWRDPPRSLEQALDRIEAAGRARDRSRPLASLAGDNLCVTGRAGAGGEHAG